MWDLLTGVSWTIIGLIIAVFIALLGVAFPLTAKEINKHNQKIAVTILSVLLVVFIICLLVQLSVEYKRIYIDDSSSESSSISESDSSSSSVSNVEDSGVADNDDSKLSNSQKESKKTKESHKSVTYSTTLPKVSIKDIYDENGYIINGIFGYKDDVSDCFYKYDDKTSQYIGFAKSQIDCEMLDVKLVFKSSDNISYKKCQLSVFVPAAESYSELHSIVADFDFNNNDSLLFQKGLYAFFIKTPSGKEYTSDYVYISKNGTQTIEVE